MDSVRDTSTVAESVEAGADSTGHRELRRVLRTGLVTLAIGFTGAGTWLAAVRYEPSQPEESSLPLGGVFSPSAATFDISNAVISRDEILRGGPPKDGIPSLTSPQFLEPEETGILQDEDRVIGVVIGNDARAYPLKILDYHEAVNDRIGDRPIVVTYCPLCDSSAVFDRLIDGREVELGISGMLYNSNVLMFDRGEDGEESLWSQMMTQAVSGPLVERRLKLLPLEVTTWADWKIRHPQTMVLSEETGHQRDYGRRPYSSYFSSDRLMFPVFSLNQAVGTVVPGLVDDRLPKKTPVLGIRVGTATRAYPVSGFRESDGPVRLQETLGNSSFDMIYSPKSNSLRVENADTEVETMYAFWFAWAAFHPETELYSLQP